MKAPLSFFRGLQGTIMIFSLFIILGGTLVLASWAQMMATRATYTVMTEEGQKRRIAMANGRALARQYVLNQIPSGSIGYFTTNLNNGWGGFQINAVSNLWTITNFSAGNPFNPFSDASFVVTNAGHISNSAESYGWTFLVRGRSPLLAGYPLAVQIPGSTNLTGATNAYKIYWRNALGFSNVADVPFTSGYTASGTGSTNGYLGFFASPMSTSSATNQLGVLATGVTCTNATNTGATNTTTNMVGTRTNTTYWSGQIEINLNSTQTNAILRFDVPSTTNYSTNISSTVMRTYTNARVTTLTIVGSAATNAMHVVLPSTNTTTTNIALSGTNNTRRIYVNAQSAGPLTLQTATFNSNYTWWLGMTIPSATLNLLTPTNTSKLTIQGGIRTAGTLNLGSGRTSANILLSPAAGLTNDSVDFIADRILWLEEQKNP